MQCIALAVVASGCLSIRGEDIEGSTSAGQGTGVSATGGATAGSSASGGQTSGGSTIGGTTGTGTSCPYGLAPPCQSVIAPSQVSLAPVPVGQTSPVFSVEIQNVGVDICLVSLPALTDGFSVVSLSIAPDPTTNHVTIPPPGSGENSSLTIDVDLTCMDAGPVSTEFLCGTLTGTCG